ncbi:MAG TPA: hypothetical protein VFH87_01805 [Candidatus Udaeobacter sp.]|nr:hypothetical protein [Candidatus Udaeobacter sp.]
MLTIPTCLGKSPLHGYGCFTSEPLEAGIVIWVYTPGVDRVLGEKPSYLERLHAYGSNARPGKLVLCGDNAAWINFGDPANLIEAELVREEFCLRTSVAIKAYTELTVSLDSDADSAWKLKCMKEGEN